MRPSSHWLLAAVAMPGELSQRGRCVIGQGPTNRQIAAWLVIAERTAGTPAAAITIERRGFTAETPRTQRTR